MLVTERRRLHDDVGDWVERHGATRAALVPVLHEIQRRHHEISEDATQEVAGARPPWAGDRRRPGPSVDLAPRDRSTGLRILGLNGAVTKGKRFTEEQIIAVLQEAGAGAPAKEICRRHGVSERSLHRWKAKYGGMEISDARRRHGPEDENRRLKYLVADLTLDSQALKAVPSEEWGRPQPGGSPWASRQAKSASASAVPVPWWGRGVRRRGTRLVERTLRRRSPAFASSRWPGREAAIDSWVT